jgi:hypothetical protein
VTRHHDRAGWRRKKKGNLRLDVPGYGVVVFYRPGYVFGRWQARVARWENGDRWFSKYMRSVDEAQAAGAEMLRLMRGWYDSQDDMPREAWEVARLAVLAQMEAWYARLARQRPAE